MRGNWWARVAIFQLVTSLFERWVNLGQPHQSWLDHSAGEDAATMAAWRLGNSLMWRYYGMYGHIWEWRYWCNFQRWGRAEHANPPDCLQVMQYYRNLANPTMNHPQWRFILGFTTLLSNYMLWYQTVQKLPVFHPTGIDGAYLQERKRLSFLADVMCDAGCSREFRHVTMLLMFPSFSKLLSHQFCWAQAH